MLCQDPRLPHQISSKQATSGYIGPDRPNGLDAASQPEYAFMPMNRQELYAATVAHYLAPIKQYLDDTTITEIMVNRDDEIFIEKDGQLHKVDARFKDKDAYRSAVNNILQFTGKSLNDDTYLIDSRLPDGSRVHVAREPCARLGTVMTIRKFNKSMLDIDWLMQLGTLTEETKEYLKIAVQAERNMLVVGGTSSGKTSLLNALSSFIPEGQRVVVIEDSSELQLQQDHVISLEAKAADRYGRGAVHIRDLFRSSLRLRPDRIIIGEVRGGEALDMIQAMTSGHGGSMGTLHANNPRDALNRLETMALMSKVELPLHALRSQVSSAIDLVVQMNRQVSGSRVVTQIAEVDMLSDAGNYNVRDIYKLTNDPADLTGKTLQLTWTGERSAYTDQLRPNEKDMVKLTANVFCSVETSDA
jgi:pilus assembly protein CpaF